MRRAGTAERNASCSSPTEPPHLVADNLTGLEWEKKIEIGAHDDDATFTFKGAYRDFLTQVGSGEGLNEISCSTLKCFADNCDWRLPTVEEMQTILSAPFPCTTSPCIPAVFGRRS